MSDGGFCRTASATQGLLFNSIILKWYVFIAKDISPHESMSDVGFCRTALTTPGLLFNSTIIKLWYVFIAKDESLHE